MVFLPQRGNYIYLTLWQLKHKLRGIPWWHSGLRVQYRPMAQVTGVVWVQSLAQELPHAMGATQKRGEENYKLRDFLSLWVCSFLPSFGSHFRKSFFLSYLLWLLCSPIAFFFFLLKYSWIRRMYQFLLYSKVIQSYMYLYIHSFSHVIFYHVLSQEIGYSFLCYTVGPHCPAILNIIVCIY